MFALAPSSRRQSCPLHTLCHDVIIGFIRELRAYLYEFYYADIITCRDTTPLWRGVGQFAVPLRSRFRRHLFFIFITLQDMLRELYNIERHYTRCDEREDVDAACCLLHGDAIITAYATLLRERRC